jgi:hypothetical protein
LLHNFTTKTYSTLTADASLWEFWRDDVVQLGLSCDYVMRAVLAVSALHLAYHRPDRRDFYIESGILLHQKAARSAMRVMAAEHEIDKDTAASLFIFSMLTIFFGTSIRSLFLSSFLLFSLSFSKKKKKKKKKKKGPTNTPPPGLHSPGLPAPL